MMEKLQRSWWGMLVPATIILSLVSSVGLPAFFPALGGTRVRFGLILASVVVLGIVAAWRWARHKKSAVAIEGGIAAPPKPGEADVKAVSGQMRDALARLRALSGKRRDYLYAKPWYLIIGPPGTGKTTAFASSGVRFPFSEGAVPGEGGTRNLDFWFAEDAVLVDTAGRYTTQDSDAAADGEGWRRLLSLLHRTRPLEPINGVIVALGVDELMGADRERLDAHAAAIRRRLGELRRALKISAPVYLLFTKTDLLAGFGDFFADLAAEGRRAVLGATMAHERAPAQATVVAEFDLLVETIWARVAKRLQDEPDQRRRSRILGFPAQISSLRARFARFVEGAFPDEADPPHQMRGFYFASSTQEGAPLDRLLRSMAAVYEEPQPARAAGRGRAFFLNRLFGEVIFPEAGLVRAEAAAGRRRRLKLSGGAVAMGGVALAAIGLWSNAYAQNRAMQNALHDGAEAVMRQERASGVNLVEVRADDPDLEQLLPLLDQLRALPHGYAAQAAGKPSWTMRLGLYQSGHARAAREAYLEGLQRIMLPRLLLECEQALRDDANAPIRLYEPLKVYMMLGGYGPLDRATVRSWVVADWRDRALPGADRADIRARLARHLDAMLADDDLGRVWADRHAPLDGRLLAATRGAIEALPLADRAYAMMQQRAAASGRPDWRAEGALAQGDARAFGNGSAVMELTVPYFYTRDGYRAFYQPALAAIQPELSRDLWVLGDDGAKISVRDQLPLIRAAIAQDYARDYIAAWSRVVETPRAANYFADRPALGAFTRTPSPLKTLLNETKRNTLLTNRAPAQGEGFDAGATISAHFRPVVAFASANGQAPAPVDTLVDAVRQAASASSASNVPGAAIGGGAAVQGQFASALGSLSSAGVVAPPELQGFVGQVGANGRGAATRSAQTTLGAEYSNVVLPACRSASDGRYPFDAGATRDVSLADLQRVYGANGQIDSFVRDRLQLLLDMHQPTWRWRRDDPVAARLAPGSAAEFQKAAALRDLAAGGIPLQISVQTLGQNVDAAEFTVGNTTYRFGAKDLGPRPMIWSAGSASQARLVLFSGKKEVFREERLGSWAFFRLIGAARTQNAAPSTVIAWFGPGPATSQTAVRIAATEGSNPLARGGPFSFRCPQRL